MKILLAASHTGSWGYLPEMIQAFRDHGCEVDLFDDALCSPNSFLQKILCRLGYSSDSLAITALRRQAKACDADYDAVNIQYVASPYRYLVNDLKRKGNRLISSVWGSDFLRVAGQELECLEYTLRRSTCVTTNNPAIRDKLVAAFPFLIDKVPIVPFGLQSVDIIRELLVNETKSQIRTQLGIPTDRITLACGYNNMAQQQHLTIFDGLAKLGQRILADVFVILPLTYPIDKSYSDLLSNRLTELRIPFKAFTDRMTLKDTCRLRLATDCAINLQTTDSLSASIQEHLLARSGLIVGDWLPYEVFEKMGAKCVKVADAHDVCARVQELVKSPESYRQSQQCTDNIYDLSCWKNCAERWVRLYKGLNVPNPFETNADPRADDFPSEARTGNTR